VSPNFILVIEPSGHIFPELPFTIFHAVLILFDESAICLWKDCFLASLITCFNILQYIL
jgi:hypothetical protein